MAALSTRPTVSRKRLLGNNSWAIFTISGRSLDPAQITQDFNMQPDRIFVTQDGRTVWQINSRLDASTDLHDHLKHLLLRLLPVRNKVKKLPKAFQIEFYCAQHGGIGKIPPELMLLAGYLRATLEVEIHDDPARPINRYDSVGDAETGD